MGNSYRLRTKIGVDKALNIALEQDFESLEILSLKILQSQIYTRQCSDYGVVVGRVSANNGLGIPNAKVSIFIPLSDSDENNPTLNDIYPYKTLNDLNDDGYRYNLLPYEKSHGGHIPTGTFPSREDVLIIPEVSEVFEKYYKYTTKTNDSGDFMLFGVPVGTQIVHLDVDLSDIGEFSLSPQDMIRLNLANEQQVSGTEFRASTNLGELPQIKQSNRTIEVVPLWGQPEICYLGITRIDFDLSQEFGIKIEPAAIFMGSIFSNVDKEAVKRNCKARKKIGNLCNLITGPGELLSIRQTINIDSDGRPVLETYELENGGKCVDENGTWLIDVPMNLDYVYTDEFGNRQISNDPNVGIPTKGKYRFKVKWEQAPSLSNEVIRGAFLVPNIKEWGWDSYDQDPSIQDANFLTEAFVGCIAPTTTLLASPQYKQVRASYAFSLDWNEYGETDSGGNLTPTGLLMVDEAVNCEDRFYEMIHSKVYTVSQMISEHRGGLNRYKIIAIKDILNEECEGTHNKFPANDGMFQNDIIYILFTFILGIFTPILFAVILLKHIVGLIVCILWVVMEGIAGFICAIADGICSIAGTSFLNITPFGFLSGLCDTLSRVCDKFQGIADDFEDRCRNGSMNLPMLTYPNCEMCSCDEPAQDGGSQTSVGSVSSAGADLLNTANQIGASTFITPFFQPSNWRICPAGNPDAAYGLIIAGRPYNGSEISRAPYPVPFEIDDEPGFEFIYSPSLPFWERLNILNTKAKYFDESAFNPGGGYNRIKASFAIDLPGNGISKWHLDNVIILMAKPSVNWNVGQMVSFIEPTNSQDPNLTGLTNDNQFNNRAITGSTRGTPVIEINDPGNPTDDDILYYQIDNAEVLWARPDGTGNNPTYYNLTARTNNNYAKFQMDVEYFQVIHNTTVGEYMARAQAVGNPFPGTLYNRVMNSDMTTFQYLFRTDVAGVDNSYPFTIPPIPPFDYPPTWVFPFTTYGASGNLGFTCLKDFSLQKLIFLVRGVDPYSTRQRCRFDISRLYGVDTDFNSAWAADPFYIVEDNFKLNIPIQGGFKCVRHLGSNGSADVYTPGEYLFHPSYELSLDPSLFQTFTSSATTTYSRMDSTYYTNTIDGWPPAVETLGPSGTLRIISNNRMTRDFWNSVEPLPISPFYRPYGGSNSYPSIAPDVYTTGDLFSNNGLFYNTTTNGRACKGYFLNEIVEGGSYVYTNDSRLAASYSPFDATTFVFNTPPIYNWSNGFEASPPFSAYYCVPYNNDPAFIEDMIFDNSERIVMRSDRLFMSSTMLYCDGTSTPTGHYIEISYPLMANNLLAVNTVNDNGLVSSASSPPGTGDAGAAADNLTELQNNPALPNNVAESLDCAGLAPLRCYSTDSDGMIILEPDTNNDCYRNVVNLGNISISPPQRDLIVENGCYKLVTAPMLTIPLDFYLVFEWSARIKLNFAACRNVFGHMFTNQWINGTLFMYPVRNQVRFTPPPENSPYICSCNQLVFPDYETNVLYYRSSPYRHPTGFVGKTNAFGFGPFDIEFEDSSGANVKLLQNPTTILDMGPRTKYTSELVLDPRYDGYVMNRLYHTSFKDVSELISQFFLSRLLSRSIAGLILEQFAAILGGGAAGVATDMIQRLFNDRGFKKVDGDYAQMVAINSQIGIKEFDPDEYYGSEPNSIPIVPTSSVFLNSSGARNNVFGIFYKEEVQLRDWISPHRLVVTPTGDLSNPCVYNDIPIFSQRVPIYQWIIKQNSDDDSIFGDQDNDWATDPSPVFFDSYYQEFDRLGASSPDSDFMHPENPTLYTYNKAYIFNVNPAGEIDPEPPLPPGNSNRTFTSSGPYYFYFGISLGKTAYDRFLVKWIKTDVYEF
jgi:hypothetical protein